jgi:hypothetical protein
MFAPLEVGTDTGFNGSSINHTIIIMLRTSLVSALALSFVLVACGDKGKDAKSPSQKDSAGGDVSSESSSSSSSAEGEVKHKFEVKSGIIEMKNSMMTGMEMTMYFDDYGEKQAMVTKMEMMGTKREQVQITADGFIISYDATEKTGTKMKAPKGSGAGSMGSTPNFSGLSDEEKKQYKYAEIEGKTVAGKEGKGVSMEIMGMKVKAWTWKGLPLFVEMSGSEGKGLTMEATKIDTDVAIPADRFVVPADVKISDASGSAGMGSAKPDTSK